MDIMYDVNHLLLCVFAEGFLYVAEVIAGRHRMTFLLVHAAM